MNEKFTSIIVSAFIGVLAYICTDVLHEVVGHGSAALVSGSTITLLTSVYFRSVPASFIIGLSGPFSNLLWGLLLFVVLAYRPPKSLLIVLSLTTVMAYNLFWFSGTILQSAFAKIGDWTYAMAQLNPGVWGKPLLFILGVSVYWASIKMVANRFSDIPSRFTKITLRQSVTYAFLFGALSAAIAGLFYAPDRWTASKEGLLEMVASLPILFLNRDQNEWVTDKPMKAGWIFYLVVSIAYLLFCFFLGRGIY